MCLLNREEMVNKVRDRANDVAATDPFSCFHKWFEIAVG